MHLVTKTRKSVAFAFFAALAATAALAGSAGAQHGTPGTTQLISRPSGMGPASAGQANASTVHSQHTVSANGRFVVFESMADGLSSEDDNSRSNVYVRDLQTGVTTFASRATGVHGAPAHSDSYGASISGDGTRVGFTTNAGLDPSDTNATADVYARDLASNTTTLVSRATGPAGAVGNKYSTGQSIDADGKRVAFSSNSTNLDPSDGDDSTDVYVRDLTSNTTTLVSRATGLAGVKGNTFSFEPSISDSGSRIAFMSCATNLDPADTNAACDIYVRNFAGLATSTWWVSKTSGGLAVPEGAQNPSLSGDGNTIAFDSQGKFEPADTNKFTDVYYHEMTFGKTYLVSRADGLGPVGNASSGYASVNTDGTKIAFMSAARNFNAADTNKNSDVYVRAAGTTRLVSRGDTAAGAGGDDYSTVPSINGDGTKVDFYSKASNFAASPGPDFTEVYLRNLSANTTTLVSRSSGFAPYAADVNSSRFGESFQNRISADGRFVVFESDADSLSNADNNRYRNVFVRDTLTDTTMLVSAGPSGGGNGSSGDETISADGTTAAFYSSASNLVAGDTNSTTDVFVRNLKTGAVTRINTGVAGADDAGLSADGTKVLVETDAALVPADTNKSSDLYVDDLKAGTITLVSRANGAAGAAGNDGSYYASMSADGRKVAFYSYATNFVAGVTGTQIYVRDLAAGTTTLVSRASGAGAADNSTPEDAVISANGTAVAFDSFADNLVPGDTNTNNDVFLRNLVTNTTTLVSRASGAAGALGNDYSGSASINAEGTKVAFKSDAGNLVGGDTNKSSDVFIRDVGANTTALVSRAANGGPANADSYLPALSANGNCVAFESDAGNIDPSAAPGDFERVFMATVARECPVDPPDTKIASAPPALTKSRTPQFAFSSNDPAASYQCSLDGAAFAACPAAYATPPVADGKHTLAVRAIDPAGYVDASPVAASWETDATAPLVKVRVPKQRLGAVRAKGLRVVISCNEACEGSSKLFAGKRLIGTVRIKLSGAGKKSLRVKLTRQAKRSLAHTQIVRLTLRTSATDIAGNVRHNARSLKLRR